MDILSYPIATILILVGLFFIFISLVRVGGHFVFEVLKPKTVIIIGILLFIAGLLSAVTGVPDRTLIYGETSTPISTPKTTAIETPTPTLTPETKVKITYPSNAASVNIQETVTGTATNVPEVQKLWILVYPLSANKFYPQNPNVNIINEEWAITVGIGTKDNVGEQFKIIAVLADQKAHEEFMNYISTGPGKGWPGMDNIPKSARVVDEVTVTREGPEVKITSPLNTAKLSDTITGTLKNIPEGKTVWISVYPKSASKYYPQNKVDNENWNLPAQFGEEKDKGTEFDIIAVLADQSAQNELKAYYDKCKNESIWPGMENLPIGTKELDRVTVIRE